MTAWPGSARFEFGHRLPTGQEIRHDVHHRGDGPPILILQELPGIGPETLGLADRLVAAGFSVWLPHLLGRFGRIDTIRNTVRILCVRREIDVFRHGGQSPVADWIRALVPEIAARSGRDRLGVIGMCLTGSFALPLMAEDAVAGAVASQPSLPFWPHRRKLHMSPAEVAAARAGMAAKGPALAMRYAGDPISSRAHMDALKAAFGPHLEVAEFPGRKHSLLTLDFRSEAFARTEDYFRARFGMP